MNLNLIIGSILFLTWSTLSTWYYVCEIKQLCPESAATTQVQATKSIPKEEVIPAEPEPEKPLADKPEPVETVLPPILIEEDKILFLKNTTRFVDPDKVSQMIEGVASEVEGRKIAVDIAGHTCDLGSNSYNLELGQRRADAVRAYLMSRLDNAQYETTSKGESEARPGTAQQRQLNRKVSITIKSIDQ